MLASLRSVSGMELADMLSRAGVVHFEGAFSLKVLSLFERLKNRHVV